jgi:hypothetical protein
MHYVSSVLSSGFIIGHQPRAPWVFGANVLLNTVVVVVLSPVSSHVLAY